MSTARHTKWMSAGHPDFRLRERLLYGMVPPSLLLHEFWQDIRDIRSRLRRKLNAPWLIYFGLLAQSSAGDGDGDGQRRTETSTC